MVSYGLARFGLPCRDSRQEMTHYFFGYYCCFFINMILVYDVVFFPVCCRKGTLHTTSKDCQPSRPCCIVQPQYERPQFADACTQQARGLKTENPATTPCSPYIASACGQGTAGERDSNRRGLPAPLSTFRNRNISVINCLSVRSQLLVVVCSFAYFLSNRTLRTTC